MEWNVYSSRVNGSIYQYPHKTLEKKNKIFLLAISRKLPLLFKFEMEKEKKWVEKMSCKAGAPWAVTIFLILINNNWRMILWFWTGLPSVSTRNTIKWHTFEVLLSCSLHSTYTAENCFKRVNKTKQHIPILHKWGLRVSITTLFLFLTHRDHQNS